MVSCPRLLALAALAVAGCGGDGEKRAATPSPRATPTPTPRPAATPQGRQSLREQRVVVEGWANALARSDVDRAARYFSLPVLIEQGPAYRVRRPAQLRLFNEGLPCGASVTAARREAGFVVVSFRLKERPGRTCDSPGGTVRVAFRFRDGKISEWRQVPDAPDPPAARSSET